ncbi:sensor histidine kinase [Phenylobacterium sp.]|uniref:sensor histidine kinase n=1 Tax=Phenylobacterium sp. TaxID=1871053 RepID=UPI0035AF7379
MTDEREYEARAAEVRHRTANSFQLISALARMRGQRSGEPEARRQLLWIADAVGALGALERHRCEGGVDLTAYLTEMALVWSRRPGGEISQVAVSVDPMVAADQVASTLALIAHELVANALVHGCHGRSGRVEVRLTHLGDGRSELAVRDDGPGFDPGAPQTPERFGLWFVRSLAQQVRGELDLNSAPGLCVRLVFPFADRV